MQIIFSCVIVGGNPIRLPNGILEPFWAIILLVQTVANTPDIVSIWIGIGTDSKMIGKTQQIFPNLTFEKKTINRFKRNGCEPPMKNFEVSYRHRNSLRHHCWFLKLKTQNSNYSTPNDWWGFWAFRHRKSKKNSCSSSELSKALHVSSNFQLLTEKSGCNFAPSQRSCCFSCSWFVEDQCLELGLVPSSQRWSRGSVFSKLHSKVVKKKQRLATSAM